MQITLSILVFLFLFSPRIAGIDLLILISLSLAIPEILFSIAQRRTTKFLFFVTWFGLTWTVYFSIVNSLNGWFDVTGPEFGLKLIIYAFASKFLLRIHKLALVNWQIGLLKSIAYAGLANAVFVLILYIFPDLHRFYVSRIDISDTQLMWLETGHRIVDFGMGGGPGASAVFAMFAPILIALGVMTKNNRWVFFLGLIFIACALTGRSGFFILSVLTPFLLLVTHLQASNKSGISRTSILFSIMIISGFAVSYYLLHNFIIENSGSDSAFMKWFAEPFEEGILETRSTIQVVDSMYFLPESIIQFIFGDGNFGRNINLPYLASDVGWIRLWHAGGIISIIAMILFGVFVSRFISTAPFEFRLIVFSSFLVIFLFFFKELHILPRGGGSFLLLVLNLGAYFYGARHGDSRVTHCKINRLNL